MDTGDLVGVLDDHVRLGEALVDIAALEMQRIGDIVVQVLVLFFVLSWR